MRPLKRRTHHDISAITVSYSAIQINLPIPISTINTVSKIHKVPD